MKRLTNDRAPSIRRASHHICEPLENRRLLSGAGLTDTEFGTNGLVTLGYRDTTDGVGAANERDGKFIVVGDTATNGQKKSAFVARFMDDGAVDPTFGTNGVTFFNPSPGNDNIAVGVAVQADGKIDVAGTAGNNLFVSQFNSNGTLNTGFASGGTFQSGFGGAAAATRLRLQTDGKILVTGAEVGVSGTSVGGNLVLLRMNPGDGSFDTSWGGNGKVLVPSPSGTVYVGTDVAEQSDGKVLVSGGLVMTSFNFTTFQPQITGSTFDLGRFNANGTTDTAFGSNGWAPASFGNNYEFATSLSIDKLTNNIVVGGSTANGLFEFGVKAPGITAGPDATVSDYAIARYKFDGKLDLSWNLTGKRKLDFSSRLDGASSVFVQGDQKVIVSGGSFVRGGNSDFAAARFNVDGSVDTGYGTNGRSLVALNGSAGAFDSFIDCYGLNYLIGHNKLNGGSGTLAMYRLTNDPVYLNPNRWTLAIRGTRGNDVISGYQYTPAPAPTVAGVVTPAATTTTLTITFNGQPFSFNEANVQGVLASLDDGNDSFNLNYLSQPMTVNGGAGADTILSGSGADSLVGGAGDDSINGGRGPDTIGGAGGNDTLVGGVGPDLIRGGAGDDSIAGGAGNDTLQGAGGNDTINGGIGNDQLFGGAGNDVFFARDGFADTLDGGLGTNSAQVDSNDVRTNIQMLLP